MILPSENLARLYAQLAGYHYMSAEDIANGSATIGNGYEKVCDVTIADKCNYPRM